LPLKSNNEITECWFYLSFSLHGEQKYQTLFSASPYFSSGPREKACNYGGDGRKCLGSNCIYGLINQKSLSKDRKADTSTSVLVFAGFQKLPISQFASGK